MGKGFSDIVNTKPFTNPKGNIKDIVKTFKKNPLEGAQMLGEPLLGNGVRYSAVNDFITSKGKVKYDKNREYDGNMLKPGYDLSDLDPKAPPAPTAEAPLAQRGRSVQESERQAKIEAAKRKGLLSTILAANKDSANKLGGGSSILG